jgi:type IV pilus assembly protein PilC
MKFLYTARNKEGQVKQGVVVASSQDKAEALLMENGFTIVAIKEQAENIWLKMIPFGKRVSYKEVVLFSRQLSTLIGARVPILQSLRILEGQISSKPLVAVVRDMITSVENGESFSLALSKHPEVFGNVYVSLVRSGEASGSVAKSLNYLADQLEKDYNLRSNVKKAFTYPIFVLSALLIVGLLMFKFVLPKLVGVLKEQGGDLPIVTKILITATDFFDAYWWVVILVAAALILFVRFYLRTPQGIRQFDTLKIKMPLFGSIFQKIYLARFSRNLATLIAGGIPIIKAIQIVGDIINNTLYKEALVDVAAKVSTGSSVSDALANHKEFPAITTQMVKVGEQSAQVDDILSKLASYYEKEVDDKVGVLATLLEPVIMIILGIAVGVLVAGVLLPIYNLASTVG